jgi:hypothetical protein
MNNTPGLHTFAAKFYQTINVELTPMFLKFFHKIESEGMLTNSFYKASTIYILKLERTQQNNKFIDEFP